MSVRGLLQKPRGWSGEESPFHAGERAVQERLGVRERMEQAGRRLMRDYMPDEHREFFEDLPFVIAASADARGALWASVLVGEPGFVRAPEPRQLVVRAHALPGDPFADNVAVGAPLGLLGIELATRRRNRVNGRIGHVAEGGLELLVEQSFGNCKQYIQARAGRFAAENAQMPPTLETASLSAEAVSVLERTDTTFIATGSSHARAGSSEGLDASHRGGRPGFIRVEQDSSGSTLVLPDFSGNNMFNSFGNLEVNPRAGLLALDFRCGAVLSLSGVANVIWDAAARDAFAGAERLLEFRPRSGWLWRGVLQDWSAAEESPHLRGTGPWRAAT
ncbi:MAG TPA: pyridoxamine 5'-phosphate oxidase family protein [Polyangiaceae bacterium]|nr:pyridoxamine 5'-phosphate oxidase family protein [Polyangiaceae bacterium]